MRKSRGTLRRRGSFRGEKYSALSSTLSAALPRADEANVCETRLGGRSAMLREKTGQLHQSLLNQMLEANRRSRPGSE